MFQRYIAAAAAGLFGIILLCGSLYLNAQTPAESTTFYIPALRSQTATGLGIALINPTLVPHIAIGGGFNSRLKLVNTHVAPQLVRVTLNGARLLAARRTAGRALTTESP
jgi:hypothetical protein